MTSVAPALSFPAQLGRAWFRVRSFSPLPLLVALVALPPELPLGGAGALAAAIVLLLSEALRAWAVGYAGGATRTRGDTVPRLVHSGPFRHVRNPLYLGNIGLYLSCCVLFGFRWLTVVAFLYFAIQYSFIVRFEESTLERLFGDAYREYARKVPRWLPTLRPAVPSSGERFSLRLALRCERSTAIAMLVMAVVYFLKGLALG